MKKLLTITIAIMLAIPQPPALAGRLRLYGAVGSESRPGGQGYALRPMAARFSGIERVQKIDRATSDRLRGILDSIEQGDEISENDEAFVKSCCLHYGFKQKEFFKPRLFKKHVKGFIDMLLLLIDIDLAPKKEYKCTTEFSSSFSVLSEDAFLHLTRNFAAAFANCVALTRHINFYGTVNIDELVGRMHRLARRMGTASQATSFFDLRDNPAILFAVVDLIVSYSTQSVPLIKEFLDAQVQHSDSDGMHILSVEESIRRVSSVDNFLRNIQLSILAPDILISCNLNELIIDTARFIFGEEEMRRSAVILDVDNTMPELRLSPSVWLVLSNLFTNARDAVEEKAAQPEAEGFYQEIKITSKYDGVNNAAVFSVVDNGVGIKEGDIPKVCNKFFTTKSDCRGVGLHLVREIVRLNGGTISVESKFGKGSTFTVTLPADRISTLPTIPGWKTVRKKVTFKNWDHLHKRPSARLMALAAELRLLDIYIVLQRDDNGRQADASNQMELLGLGIMHNGEVWVSAGGPVDKKFLETAVGLVAEYLQDWKAQEQKSKSPRAKYYKRIDALAEEIGKKSKPTIEAVDTHVTAVAILSAA